MPLMTDPNPAYKIAPAGMKWVIMAREDVPVPWYEHLFIKPRTKARYVRINKSKYRSPETASAALRVEINARGGIPSDRVTLLPRYYNERGQEVALADPEDY